MFNRLPNTLLQEQRYSLTTNLQRNMKFDTIYNNLNTPYKHHDIKQIFYAFLFNIRNYSPEEINIRRLEVKLNITEGE